MSDVTQGEAQAEPATDASAGTEFLIPVTKGKGTISINTADLPDDVYREVILQGLKVLVNRGASKITKETYPKPDELKAAAMAKAEEQVELIKTSKIKFSGQAKAKKASGAVMTEARRLAKNLVKDEMKRQGIRISHVDAKDITKAANELLEVMPELIAQAEANVAERDKTPVKIDLGSLIHVNPDKVAKAEAKKKDKPLSAKQAGMTAKRKKGEAVQTAH